MYTISPEYNIGYKLLDKMEEKDWAGKYDGCWITFDNDYTFDTY